MYPTHAQATDKLEALEREHEGKMLFPTLSEKRVLSFAPDVLPLHFDDETDFRAAVMGLVQVSTSNAVTSLSDLACGLSHESARARCCFPTLSMKHIMSFAPDVLPLHFDDEVEIRAAVKGPGLGKIVQLFVRTCVRTLN